MTSKGRVSKKEEAVEYVNEVYDLDLVYHKNTKKSEDGIAEAIMMVEGLVWNRYEMEKVRMFKD